MAASKHGYNALQISLHWVVAALVLFQLVFGESMTNYVDAAADGRQLPPYDETMGSMHYWVGLAILMLVFVRLAVRIIVGPADAENTIPKWMALASRASHLAFYCLLVAVPASGLLAYYVRGWMGDIHALAKPAFIVLISAHAAAALFHQFWLRDGTLKRMLLPSN
jgi:cytochrome b561